MDVLKLLILYTYVDWSGNQQAGLTQPFLYGHYNDYEE